MNCSADFTLARCSVIWAYPMSVIWTLSLASNQLSPSAGVYTAESIKDDINNVKVSLKGLSLQ